jgi:hypothetical protein
LLFYSLYNIWNTMFYENKEQYVWKKMYPKKRENPKKKIYLLENKSSKKK